MIKEEHDITVHVLVLNEKINGLKSLMDERDRWIKEKSDQFNALKKENDIEYRQLTERFVDEHNRLTQLAIDKAEAAMRSKTDSMNEFRAQQADMIETFAREDKLESYIKSSTERYEANVRVVNDKLYQLEKQMDAQITQGIQIITDKFEAMNRTSNVKLENVEVVMEKRFTDIMKDYIRPLFDWKNNMQGRGFVLLLAWPILVAIVAFILSKFIH